MIKIEVFENLPDNGTKRYTVHRYPRNTPKDDLYRTVDAIHFLGGYTKYTARIVY